MNKLMNEYEHIAALINDHEFQVFNMTVPGFTSFLEEPEIWAVEDFEDVISPYVKTF